MTPEQEDRLILGAGFECRDSVTGMHLDPCRCPDRPLMPGGESTSAQLRQTQSALAASQADLTRAEQHQEIRARALREKNAKLREVEHLLGIDAIVPHCDVADAVRDLLAELEQLRVAACPDPAAHTTTDRSTDA